MSGFFKRLEQVVLSDHYAQEMLKAAMSIDSPKDKATIMANIANFVVPKLKNAEPPTRDEHQTVVLNYEVIDPETFVPPEE
jgi:hypothetical protein